MAQGIRFYGDVLLSRGVASFAEDQGLAPIEKALDPFLKKNAIHVMNLEGAIGSADRCADHHIPCFAVNNNLLSLLNGADVVSIQNNHSLDLGPAGLQASLRELKKRNIVPLGCPSFSTIITTDDGNFGIVAVTDVVNAPGDRSYLAMADSHVVLKEIRRLKARSTAVAVYIHWGRELLPVPTDRMGKLARAYIKAGADIIVGTHPHVPGSVACVDGKPVVWSLGNFLFDQKYEETKKGAVLDWTIGDGDTLSCTLTAHETARSSYLPRISGGDSYARENIELATCRPVVHRTWTGVFTKDKREKKLVLTRDGRKNALSFFTLFDMATGRPEARTPPMPIIKVQPFDLNGDGILEVMLIQNIYSPFDRETAKRVYLYSFANNFHALWRGSALARPLLDAVLVREKKGTPFLAALHSADSYLLRKPGCMERLVMFYRWNGFGFSGVKEHRIESGSEGLVSNKGKLRIVTRGNVTSEIRH